MAGLHPYEESQNPYASPEITEDTPYHWRDRPPGKGLLWLLFSFNGRIPRRSYWGATLAVSFIFYGTSIGADVVFGEESLVPVVVSLGLFLPAIWMLLAVQVKRWHDRSKSGWWVLINLVPYVGSIWSFIENGCLRGAYGDNQYGADPT